MSMRQFIKETIKEVCGVEAEVFAQEKENYGHYSTNVAFSLAKENGTAPLKMAEELVVKIRAGASKKFFDKVEAAKPGFVNFWLSNETILKRLNFILGAGEDWGSGNEGKGKAVVIDYFQPNVAKALHVGHLRSAVIGDALKRILISQGYKVVADTHLGDWGTQFGILIYGYKQLDEKGKKKIEEDPFRGLNELYVKESKIIEERPERREMAKEEFSKLEKGDKENREIWRWMTDVSFREFVKIIKKLGLLLFEEHRGESVYENDMPKIIQLASKKNLAKRTEDGALVIDISEEGLGEAVLAKSDGASTYLLRDLATMDYRARKRKFEKNLYVVDTRQSLYFRQLFRVAELLEIGGRGTSEHIQYGFTSLPEGAMSTRKGNTIALDDVLQDVVGRAREIIKEKNPNLKNKEEVAQMIGVGALKYFDLSHQRESNIVFEKERALSFEGNTAPYVQYTNARLLSILRKAKNVPARVTEKNFVEDEGALAAMTLRLPEVAQDVLKDWTPNTLVNYLFSLAKKANEWYHAFPVLQEEDRSKREFRLGLARAVSITLVNGLYLLGIRAPEEM